MPLLKRLIYLLPILILWHLPVAAQDSVLLNEIKANPVGADDVFEYIEIIGTPNAELQDVILVAVNGLGRATLVVNLDSQRLDANGLLTLTAPRHPYTLDATSATLEVSGLLNGALANNSTSLFLFQTSETFIAGTDYDKDDDGIFDDDFPLALTLDSIAWAVDDHTYAEAIVPRADALTRLRGNRSESDMTAWYYGGLSAGGASLTYSAERSADFPDGGRLSPAALNEPSSPPTIQWVSSDRLDPQQGVLVALDDPSDPAQTQGVRFRIEDSDSYSWTVTAQSSNQNVISEGNLQLSNDNADYTLQMIPIAVGVTTITLSVIDEAGHEARIEFPYEVLSASHDPYDTRYHSGIGRATRAIAVDGDYMLVASADAPQLALYHRRLSGLPISTYDFSAELPADIRIIGVFREERRIYWLGISDDTYQLFATDIRGVGAEASLSFVNVVVLPITVDNTADFSPDSTDWELISFTHAPLVDKEAWLVFNAATESLLLPLSNYAALIADEASTPEYATPINLSLGDHHIRDIACNDENCLILTNSEHGTRLFYWSGSANDEPLMANNRFEHIDTTATTIVALPDDFSATRVTGVQLILDSIATQIARTSTRAPATLQQFTSYVADVQFVTPDLAATPQVPRFYPALNTLGLLLPGENGLLGERIEWLTTVRNNGTQAGQNLTVTATLPNALQIDSFEVSHGLGAINGQTVTITVAELAPDEMLTLRVITSVLQSNITVHNSACLTAQSLATLCVNSAELPTTLVSELPATGESSRARDGLVVLVVFILAFATHYWLLRDNPLSD